MRRPNVPRALLAIALTTIALGLGGFTAAAQSDGAVLKGQVATILDRHVLPRYQELTETTARLADTAARHCRPEEQALRTAFQDAYDAWIGVAHLTFGPAEVADRQFALSFWPDTRGMTPRSLARLLAESDPIARDPAGYAEVSVAARGFPALEFLLHDPVLSVPADPAYHCALVQAVAMDINTTASALAEDWRDRFATLMRDPGANDRFQSPQEAIRALYGALDHGLEFTADVRLGRPLGSFERPRPELAEARRSGRSLRHVIRSLEALGELAGLLARDMPGLSARLTAGFAAARDQAAALDDPVFAGVAEPLGRIRVESLQQRVRALRDLARGELGPALGVAAGFNALDGD